MQILRPFNFRAATATFAGIFFAVGAAQAAEPGDFPTKAVKIVVPYAAGATTDILARVVAKSLEESWKQSVLVENLPGGGGLTGAGAVSRAPADGHTLVIVTSSHVISPALMKSPPFDPVTAFSPVTLMIKAPTLILSGSSSGIASVAALVENAKTQELGYGTTGVGSMYHVTMARFAKISGAKLVHIPYRGSGPAMNDLMGGHLPLQAASIAYGKDFILGGKVNGLAIASEARHPMLPAVATFTEQGYPLISSEWWALLAPAGVPDAILDKVSRDVGAVLRSAAIKEKFPAEEISPSTPAALLTFMKSEADLWGRTAREAGIVLE